MSAGRQPRACVDSRLKGPVALALHRVRVGRAHCEILGTGAREIDRRPGAQSSVTSNAATQ
jgi:hypothetical protein